MKNYNRPESKYKSSAYVKVRKREIAQKQEKIQKEQEKYDKLGRRFQYGQYVQEFYTPKQNQNTSQSRSKDYSKERHNDSFGRDPYIAPFNNKSISPAREQHESDSINYPQYKSVKVTKKAYNHMTPQNEPYSYKGSIINPEKTSHTKPKSYKISSNNPQSFKKNLSFLAKQGEIITKSEKITNKYDKMNQLNSERDNKGHIIQSLNNNYLQSTPDNYQNVNRNNYKSNNYFTDTNQNNQRVEPDHLRNQRNIEPKSPNIRSDYYNYLSKNILQNIMFGDEKSSFKSNLLRPWIYQRNIMSGKR